MAKTNTNTKVKLEQYVIITTNDVRLYIRNKPTPVPFAEGLSEMLNDFFFEKNYKVKATWDDMIILEKI